MCHTITVGKHDAEIYEALFGADALYIPHPVSDLVGRFQATRWNGSEKLRVCLAGDLSRFYTAGILDEFVTELVAGKTRLIGKIELYFLGHNLEKRAGRLASEGYVVHYMVFADSFEKYLAQCHLFVAPLAVGAGTKNRVLTAIGLGLDIVGTPVALENVYGMKVCNLATNGREIVDKIDERLRNKQLLSLNQEEMRQFFSYHSRDKWTEEFWGQIAGLLSLRT